MNGVNANVLCFGCAHVRVVFFLLHVWKQSIIFCLSSSGVSSFFDSLSNSLRENIAHVATAAGAVVSEAPEPVFDRMQV